LKFHRPRHHSIPQKGKYSIKKTFKNLIYGFSTTNMKFSKRNYTKRMTLKLSLSNKEEILSIKVLTLEESHQ
jgi:hypothetical protein